MILKKYSTQLKNECVMLKKNCQDILLLEEMYNLLFVFIIGYKIAIIKNIQKCFLKYKFIRQLLLYRVNYCIQNTLYFSRSYGDQMFVNNLRRTIRGPIIYKCFTNGPY